MALSRIFSENPVTAGATVQLSGGAARHVTRVLRLGAGDDVILFDGSGSEFESQVISVARTGVIIMPGSAHATNRESPRTITLWQGICRNPRMDTVVQKATELGAAQIQPVYTERGIIRLDQARERKRLRHWKEVVISACEQCGRNRIPEVCPPLRLTESLEQVPRHTQLIMLDPDGGESLGAAIVDDVPLVLLSGPEGGFTDAEKAAAIAAGFKLVRMGYRILRTETASLVALGIVQYLDGDLN